MRPLDATHLPEQLAERLQNRLTRQQNKARLRQLQQPGGRDFSSNDYLGLADHPAIRQAIQTALEDGIPLGSGGSRLLRGNTNWHTSFEAELASWKGTQAALLFSSGYTANVGVIGTLVAASDLVLSDALIHASMVDGVRESKAAWHSFRHNDMRHLAELLETHAQHQGQVWILAESLYSMDGDRAPLNELFDLASQYKACLIVDEAHATGVFGPQGQGLINQAGLDANLAIAIHTCGKAWGSSGAFVTCPQLVKDYLINMCRGFIYSTAPAPLQIAHWRAAKALIIEEPQRSQKVLQLAEHFRHKLGPHLNLGHSDTQIVPVILGDDQHCLNVAAQLQAQGFDIRAIRPPSVPRGSARLRISFNANQTQAQIDDLIQCLANILNIRL